MPQPRPAKPTRYVTATDYVRIREGGALPELERSKWLQLAQQDIDLLTYNRILAQGFKQLSPNQRETIQLAVCLQAEFLFEYGEYVNTPLQAYGINGVNMSFGGNGTLVRREGVATLSRIDKLLESTGLTYRGVC